MRLIFFATLAIAVSTAHGADIVTLESRPGVKQSFLVESPVKPQAIALLFPGSGGRIGLRADESETKFNENAFFIRNMHYFLERGIVPVVIDAPSDQQADPGMRDEFRTSREHVTDVSAALGALERKFTGLPVFLFGMSRGTVSAATIAPKLDGRIVGVVLASTVFRPSVRRGPGPGLSRFDFNSINVPLLLVHHINDGCPQTPYADARRLSAKYPLISVSGGRPAESGECESFSNHGYYGKEAEVFSEIAKWMLRQPFRTNID